MRVIYSKGPVDLREPGSFLFKEAEGIHGVIDTGTQNRNEGDGRAGQAGEEEGDS